MGQEEKGIMSTVVHRAPWWVPWLLIFVIFGSYIVYQFTAVNTIAARNQQAREMIRDAQIASCERVNDLRIEVNDHGEVLRDFLTSAAAARLADGARDVANEYIELTARLDEVELIVCDDAFPEDIARAGYSP